MAPPLFFEPTAPTFPPTLSRQLPHHHRRTARAPVRQSDGEDLKTLRWFSVPFRPETAAGAARTGAWQSVATGPDCLFLTPLSRVTKPNDAPRLYANLCGPVRNSRNPGSAISSRTTTTSARPKVAESGPNSATGNAAASTRVQRASVSIMLSPSDRDKSPGARVAGAAECRFCDITGAHCPGG